MAGRISQDFIEQLKDRVDIVDFLSTRMTLKRAGKEYLAVCPFHDDTKPSLTISPQKQFYHCFACGANGNALKFLMEHDRLAFPDAVEALASFAGVAVEYEAGSAPSRRREGPDPAELLEKIAAWYSETLTQHQPGKTYLKNRGLDGKIAKQYGLGFAPASKEHIDKLFATNPAQERLLLTLGMITDDERGRRARFRNRLMFPIRDGRGRVVGFGGRVLGDGIPKYMNSSDSFLFKKGELLYGQYEGRTSKAGYRLVVEGYTDVLALAAHGIDYAVATLGTAATEMHFQKLFRLEREVVLCFDGDTAGFKAAERAFETALPQLSDGRRLRIMFMPEGEDPDTFINGKGVQAFADLQQQALSPEQFIAQHLGKQFNLQQADDAAAFAQDTARLLALLPTGGALVALLTGALARHIGLEEQVLRGMVAQVAPPRSRAGSSSAGNTRNAHGQQQPPPPMPDNLPDYAEEFINAEPDDYVVPGVNADVANNEHKPADSSQPDTEQPQPPDRAAHLLRRAITLLYQSASSGEDIDQRFIAAEHIDDLKVMAEDSPYAQMLLEFYGDLVVAADCDAQDRVRGQWLSRLSPAMTEQETHPPGTALSAEVNVHIRRAGMASGARPKRLYAWLQKHPGETSGMDEQDAVAVRKLLSHNDSQMRAELQAVWSKPSHKPTGDNP